MRNSKAGSPIRQHARNSKAGGAGAQPQNTAPHVPPQAEGVLQQVQQQIPPAPQQVMPAEYYTSGLSPEHAAYGASIRQAATPAPQQNTLPVEAYTSGLSPEHAAYGDSIRQPSMGVLGQFTQPPVQSAAPIASPVQQIPPMQGKAGSIANPNPRPGKSGGMGRGSKSGGMMGQVNNPTLMKQKY